MRRLRIIILLLCAQFAAACGASHEAVESAPPETAAAEVSVYSEDADLAEPAIAAAEGGNAYVAYVEHRADKSSDVYVQTVGPDLKLSGQRVRVNKIEGEAKTWAGDPPTIAAAAGGTVYVGWTRRVKTAEGSGTDLMLSVSRDGGQTFGDPVKVNDDTLPASHGMHSLAIGKNGEVFVAWLDERSLRARESAAYYPESSQGYYILRAHNVPGENANHQVHKAAPEEAAEPNSEVYFAVSRDGGKTFSANKKVAEEVCPCCKTSMAVAPDGRLYLSWRQVLPGSFRHIAVAASDDRGVTFKQPVIVSDDKWELHACPVSGASMAADADGKLKVIWYSAGNAGNPGLFRAESKDGGRSFGPRSQVSSEAMSGLPVLLSVENNAAIYVFGAPDGRVALASSDQPLVADVPDGSAPAAALSSGKVITAFVRQNGNARSVRLVANNLDDLVKH